MAEKPVVRPTKKQRQTLVFIDNFIKENGYSPSYREIMSGCNYASAATVSLHVNSLISRGHLKKRDYSARSLEVVKNDETNHIKTSKVTESQEKWLVEKVDFYFSQIEQERSSDSSKVDQLYVLVGALKVLGLEGAAQSFIARLTKINASKGNK